MELFKEMIDKDYEQVVFAHDATSGLKAIIAIHDTTLGPALGGCRMWPYESEEVALRDALRLARGMTYKNAAAGLNIGGAKTVVIGDSKKDKSEALFRALGRYVESLNGRYIISEDVGTTTDDMNQIYMETNYVTGSTDAANSSGNPSPVTARGVYHAMKRTALEAFGDDSLAGKTISLQGAGNVATTLAKLAHEEGAKIVVTDINQAAAQNIVTTCDAKMVGVDEIYDVQADIFAPCALGAILDDNTIPRLKVKAICGSANNQLLDIDKHGKMVEDYGMVYAPDYIANAGGVINVADELKGYNEDRALKRVKTLYQLTGEVFDIAKKEHITTAKAADRLAEKRIDTFMRTRSNYLTKEKSVLKH